MLAALHLNQLQRKVLLVTVLIILLPMLITGMLSAHWVSTRIDDSIERWVRESAQLDENALSDLHKNARLFADIFSEMSRGEFVVYPGRSPVPANLQPLARELGISLVQVYGPEGQLVYSSRPLSLATSWAPGQDTAVVKVNLGRQNLLAAITISRIPTAGDKHYRLVLGTLFDKALLDRVSRMSGLKTRLFYPDNGDFAKAFGEDGRPLKLRLSEQAFAQLQNKQPYYSPVAEDGHYWGLYTPVIDSSGHLEAVWFSGHERTRFIKILGDETALSLVIVLLGLMLALVVGLVLSRVVVRPVEYLHAGVMRLAAQDFRAEIPIHSHDELGELASAFNAMADSLRKARDEQQREFQRDKLSALGELSLAMAHEIRNPIGIINTASKLLDTATDAPRRSELCRVIHEESQRLNHLLNDFQQLARHRRPQFQRMDPTQPLEKALQVMLAGCEDVRLRRNYQHGSAEVSVDVELLRQAWLNLLRNALEAMPDDDAALEVGSRRHDGIIEVYIHDNGPGIPIEHMPRLFEPFYTSKDHGSGLGLTIASTLVEASGGELELVPGDWQGARFAMRLPLANQNRTSGKKTHDA